MSSPNTQADQEEKLTVVFVQDVVDVAEEVAKPVEEAPLQRTGNLLLMCTKNAKS